MLGQPSQAAVTAGTKVHFDTIDVFKSAGRVIKADADGELSIEQGDPPPRSRRPVA